MDSISKSYKNKGDILNESKYVDKIINHLKNDLLGSRIELKKIFSISTEEYFDILEYEVELINSLKGEIFDTSDPKWSGCGNYEFEFEIDKSHITDRRHPEDEYIIFKGDIIDIDVDVDVHGTVFLESSMLDNPGREWTIGEATNNKTIGYMIISEIRDVITTIIEQRLPILKNLRTLNICNVEEEWVTKLSNEGKGNINEGVYTRGNQSDYLEYVYNDLVKNTKWRDASFSQVDLYDGKCKSIQIIIRWGSAAPYFLAIPECLENHLKNICGLTWEEIKELFWGRYEEYVINMVLDKKKYISPHIRARVGYLRESVMDYQISDQGTMGTLLPESTKSVGDNSEFLNKMIDYLVDATELIEVPHHPKIRVKYPFVDYSPNNKIPHMWYESIPKVIFIVGIMENYGVNTEEAHFVLDEYREKLRDKVKTKLP